MEFHDDLFGDNSDKLNALRLSTRLDELRRNGCNQRVAWSKLGCIALIDAAGTGVETRHLACNPEDGKWLLSDAYRINGVAKHHDEQKLQHLEWSSHGADLAVVDVLGNVSFFTVHVAINTLTFMTILKQPDNDDDSNALAGFWWLPAERPFALHSATKLEGRRYHYQTLSFRSFGPFHPVQNKGAAIGVTGNGTVKLWYHDGIMTYKQVSSELESLTTLNDIFTHASMSWTWGPEASAILAVYTNSRQLRVYKLQIKWNILPPNPPQPQGAPPVKPTTITTPPTLVIQRIKIIDSVLPLDCPQDPSRLHLTHLEVLSPMVGNPGAQLSPSTVLCVFSGKHPEGNLFSVVSRWDLKDTPSSSHPSFEQLNMRRASISSPVSAELDIHRLEEVMLDKCVIRVSSVMMGTIVSFASSDGTFEFRDRNHLQPFPATSLDKITGIFQSDFSFTENGDCLELILSPNNAVAVRLNYDHELIMQVMSYTRGPVSEAPHMEIACVSLATQHAYSCSNYLNNDDLLLVARKYQSKAFNSFFLTEVHKALALKMDFAVSESPSERLVRNPLLQRCLSLQFALDFQGENTPANLPGKLAWSTLHLRVASLAFGLTWNSAQRHQTNRLSAGEEFKISEALESLKGLVRWFMDMQAFIVSDLFDLAKECQGRTTDLAFVREKMVESNSPALLLLLASSPRAFMRYNCRSLRGLESITNKPMPGEDPQSQAEATSFRLPIDLSPIRLGRFEKMLTDIDGTIRAAYQEIKEPDRIIAERDLFVKTEIPAVFAGSVDRILGELVKGMKNDVELAKLFFKDTSWLGMSDDIMSRMYRKKTMIDAVRKTEIKPDGGKVLRLRRCTRCCSIVEEAVMSKTTVTWLGSFNRMCLCGTLWMHLQ
ncbi:mediator complex, subunit Med16 [Pyronema domesticum]|nr:mediator complex, subunit Med16 [Pyronema domesticum]